MPAGTHLTVVNGDMDVRKAETVIDSIDLKGQLLIEASNVVVKRSLIEGRHGATSIVVVSGSNISFSDDEINCISPATGTDDMNLMNSTVTRINAHGGVDGIKIHGTGSISDSYIHGLSWFPHDPSHANGPTHNDSIQILSATGIRVFDNYLGSVAQDNSAIQVTQDVGTVNNLVISDNYADGGSCTFNFSSHNSAGKRVGMSGITVTDNRFGRDSSRGCAIVRDLKTTIVASGNVYDDNGAPVVIVASN